MLKMIDKYKEIASKYDFLSTSLISEVPKGWLNLVDEMAEKIQEEIEKSNIKTFIVMQMKEKCGMLTVYSFGANDVIDNIVLEYEKKSKTVCCECGKPATKISLGWICPWCNDCAEKISGSFRDI